VAKAEFNKNKTFPTGKIGLNLRTKPCSQFASDVLRQLGKTTRKNTILDILISSNIRYTKLVYTHTDARSCLRRCATSRKVVGSIPDGAIGIFY
jgi:hypothetical protein